MRTFKEDRYIEQSDTTGQDSGLGVFTVFALVLLLWGYCWFQSYAPFRTTQRINVIFREIAGLNDNAAVFVDGVRVGVVENLEWQRENRVLVRLRINTVIVPQGSRFEILTNGVVGAKYVEIDFPPKESGAPTPPPLQDSATVMGDDPVRPELAVNKLAIGLSKIDTDRFQTNLEEVRSKMVRAADEFSALADATTPVAHRLNRVLNDPHFSADLKETAQKAQETALSIQAAIRDLNVTLTDQPLRKDLLDTLTQLNNSAHSIERSVGVVQKISSDTGLRTDIKQMLVDARRDLDKVNNLLDDPNYAADFKATLEKTRSAVDHVDLVARQMNQILEKRHPLLHMLTGRPGHIKVKETEVETTIPASAEAVHGQMENPEAGRRF
jgi:phospholipid/cholesterol/gamma-HCH transport system substrate-binding protein